MSDSSNSSRSKPAPRNVAEAVVLKDEDIFFIAQRDGQVPKGNLDGFGLYYHDCRYLNGYELRFAGTVPNALMFWAGERSMAQFELTNEEIRDDAARAIPAQELGAWLKRVLDASSSTVHDTLTLTNYGARRCALPVRFSFGSAFEDLFEIRGLHPGKIGRAEAPSWKNGVLEFQYDGADGLKRALEIHFHPKPTSTTQTSAEFEVAMPAGGSTEIALSLHIVETREAPREPHPIDPAPAPAAEKNRKESHSWLDKHSEIRCDWTLLSDIARQSLLDLRMLRGRLGGLHYFAAGLPWYGALFGRDSIFAALQTLAYEPRMAEQTARLLAAHQATGVNDWTDAEPGKILHELRRGELANLNEIPQTPYYGSVDATPLFLILIGEHANWTGDDRMFKQLRPRVENALKWIDNNCRAHGGYLAYESKSKKGLSNQGWKDSGDSIMNADGSLAEPPIALVEVQGYVYLAKLLMADLFERTGARAKADELRQQARDLKSHFNRDFWVESTGFYAIALQKDLEPAEVIASNPGQALWTGIVDSPKAAAVAKALIGADMFNGWGIRTLSAKEVRYNPIGYHLGTVWPHDNSIVAAGFRRYGFDDAALSVFEGILRLASQFENYRLPEVVGGFSTRERPGPVRYPVACHPQAWAAGAIPFLLTGLLGLKAEAFERRLRIVRPLLPASVNELEFRRLRVGKATVDLRFTRSREGRVEVEAAKRTGDLDVQIERVETIENEEEVLVRQFESQTETRRRAQ